MFIITRTTGCLCVTMVISCVVMVTARPGLTDNTTPQQSPKIHRLPEVSVHMSWRSDNLNGNHGYTRQPDHGYYRQHRNYQDISGSVEYYLGNHNNQRKKQHRVWHVWGRKHREAQLKKQQTSDTIATKSPSNMTTKLVTMDTTVMSQIDEQTQDIPQALPLHQHAPPDHDTTSSEPDMAVPFTVHPPASLHDQDSISAIPSKERTTLEKQQGQVPHMRDTTLSDSLQQDVPSNDQQKSNPNMDSKILNHTILDDPTTSESPADTSREGTRDLSPQRGLSDLSAVDVVLRDRFPAQFFTQREIREIEAEYKQNRQRREIDGDLCCKTDVWFGSAPTKLTDVDNSDPWTILTGDDVHQAYARGDCHHSNPQPSCPTGGVCQQKTRLHILWVVNGTDAKIKYFNINSHCSYENM